MNPFTPPPVTEDLSLLSMSSIINISLKKVVAVLPVYITCSVPVLTRAISAVAGHNEISHIIKHTFSACPSNVNYVITCQYALSAEGKQVILYTREYKICMTFLKWQL